MLNTCELPEKKPGMEDYTQVCKDEALCAELLLRVAIWVPYSAGEWEDRGRKGKKSRISISDNGTNNLASRTASADI